METLHQAQGRVETKGVPIDPLAEKAAKNILEIFDGLSIDSREMVDDLKIPVVSAYVKGMQALSHDAKNIDFYALKEQVHYAMACELASRQALGGKKP